MNNASPIGICVLREAGMNQSRTCNYPHYIFEILDHAGLFYTRVEHENLESQLAQFGVLVTIGDADVPSALAKWVENGGAWLSVAGTCAMDELLGAIRSEPKMWSWAGGVRSLGEGFLTVIAKDHPVLSPVIRPVHFFGGATVVARDAKILARADDKHGRETDRPALLEKLVGKGRMMLLAPDITGSIVRIQQGIPVTRDGVPAPDGSAPTDDHVLKADDGQVLDYDLDRDPVPGMANYLAFLEPAADVLREILLRCIFHLAREQNVPLTMLWLYPRRLPALAQMSHDTDGNEPEKCDDLLRLLDEAKIKTTWCTIVPGYDAERTAAIKRAGHELAVHYDAISEGLHWSFEEFRDQIEHLRNLFGESPISNKNHLARWENDTEFWEWCVKLGIQIDQTKAVSKTGEVAFNFGTCHPYFPVTFTGEKIDCLELCTHIWDLIAFAPPEIIPALLASVKRHHGILHQLFHPYHTIRPEIGKSLIWSVNLAREQGFEWWTAKQINDWERTRRKVLFEADSGTLTIRSNQELRDATILHLRDGGNFHAWGFEFDSVVQTIAENQPARITLSSTR